MNLDNNELSEIEDWDKVWGRHDLPQIVKTKYHPYNVDILDEFFHKYLPYNQNISVFEFGCAPGRWLHYFHQEFGYKISGIDNSNKSIEITRKNLELLACEGDVKLGDVMNYTSETKFDAVFSFGLIEHFSDPRLIISKHIEILKPGGYLVIGVPNLFSPFYYLLQKIANKPWIDIHNKIIKDNLISLIDGMPLELEVCTYLGVFNLYLLNIAENKIFLLWLVKWLEAIIDKFLRFYCIKYETKFFSPYIFLIAKRTA